MFEEPTHIEPLAVIMLAFCAAFIFASPRRCAVLPILTLAFFLPTAQHFDIFELDFHFLRILIIVGLTRIAWRREWIGINIHRIDHITVIYVAVGIVVFTIQQLSFAAFIFKVGVSLDVLGSYVVFRCLIRSFSDTQRVAKMFAWLSIASLPLFIMELSTGYNLFSIFGGVPASTMIREGRLRCQGPFPHPILAGCCYATLAPLLLGILPNKGLDHLLKYFSVTAALLIVILTASATPMLGVIAASAAIAFFPALMYMRYVRWTLLVLICALQVAMQSPFWSLIARVDVVGGSTAYYRFLLIDAAVTHFHEWWLMGVGSTASWGTGLSDVTCQYVLEAVRGGVWSLLLFIYLLWAGLDSAGAAARHAGNPWRRWAAWTLGASLFAYAVCLVGVSCAGQTLIVLPLLTSLIVAMQHDQKVGVTDTSRRPTHSRRHRDGLPIMGSLGR